ncbi:sulfite exporter TauE/SafE family protein [Thiohalobacter thiocyanaticus]|uniref:Probable membrane transporter protein n=1 Tax=Thiohalobacter thiocyanaticus TaxID=585455 RepID=A0A426QDT7_9GAMM|nr:sulfite exporter TauE/SafE family protein [Thiohalobacter thiocyanaticus]
MTPLELTLLVLLAFAGSFIQALTGFALGLIVMGLASLLELASIPFLAAVVSMISMANGAWVLGRHPRAIDWPQLGWMTLGLAPMIVLGMALLAWMNTAMPVLLQQLLGVVILAAALVLFFPATRCPGHRERPRGFSAAPPAACWAACSAPPAHRSCFTSTASPGTWPASAPRCWRSSFSAPCCA